jgi:hypothetical protein
MKEHPILFSAPMVRTLLDGSKTQTRRVCKLEVRAGMPEPEWQSLLKCCPYGQPGDQLWVRETFRAWPDGYAYRADYRDKELGDAVHAPWKPSIFMPRAASRITLEISGVRVERLQDISEADAKKEGIEPFTDFKKSGHWLRYDKDTLNGYVGNPVESYASLWESINGPRSWDANPWVWVVEFKVAKP